MYFLFYREEDPEDSVPHGHITSLVSTNIYRLFTCTVQYSVLESTLWHEVVTVHYCT